MEKVGCHAQLLANMSSQPRIGGVLKEEVCAEVLGAAPTFEVWVVLSPLPP